MEKKRKYTRGNSFKLSIPRTLHLRRLFVMLALLVATTTMWAARVTYNRNYGTIPTQAEIINQYHHPLKNVTDLGWSRTGYEFVGWNTNKNATTAQYRAEQDIIAAGHNYKQNITLYAIWIQVFTVTVNNGNQGNITIKRNDTGSTISSGTTVPKGTSVTISTSAWDSNNYVFSQWSNNVKDNPYTVTVNNNINITAQWKRLCTLNVRANEGGTVTVKRNDTGATVNSGERVPEGTSVTCTVTPDATYRFVKWDNNNTNNPYTFTVNSDINRTATLEKLPRLNITSSLPELSTITIKGVTRSWGQWQENGTTYQPGDYVAPGTNVRVTVTTAAGARFTWSDNNSTTTPRVIENIQSDVNLTANVVSDNIAPKFYDIKDGVRGAELQLVPGTTNSYRLTREYDTPGQKEYIFVERPNGEKDFNIHWIDRVPTNPYFDGNNGYRLQLDAPAYGEHRTLCFTVTSSSGAKTETYTINISTKPKAGSNFSMDMLMNTNATTFGYDKANSTMNYTVNGIANESKLDILNIATDYILKPSEAKSGFTAMLGSKADWQEFNSQSLLLSYDLPEGEKFTLNNVIVPIMAENTNSDICLQFIDSKGHKIECKNGGNPIRPGMVWDYSLTNPFDMEFEGKISLLVYGYGNQSDGFRIGDHITMTGTLTRPEENEANTDLQLLTYDGREIPLEYDGDDVIRTQYDDVHSVSTYVPVVEAVAADKFAHVAVTQPASEDGTATIVVTSSNGSTNTYTVHFVASSKTPSSDLVWNTKGSDIKLFKDSNGNDVKAVYATDDEGNVYRLTLNLQDDDDYKGERLFLSSHSGSNKISLKGIGGANVKGRFHVGETLACESYRILQSGTALPVASASAITSEERFTTSAFAFAADKTYTFDFSNDVRISSISWSPIEEYEKQTRDLIIATSGEGTNKMVTVTVTNVLTNAKSTYTVGNNTTQTFTVNEGDRIELTASGGGVFHQWKNNATNLPLHTQNPLVIENIGQDFNITAEYIKENDIDVLGLAQFDINTVSKFGSNATRSMSDGGDNTNKDILIDTPSTEVTSLGGQNGFKIATNGSFKITNQSDKNFGVNPADLVDVQIVTDEGQYKLNLDPSPTDAEISNYGNVWTYCFDSSSPKTITVKNNTSRSIIVRGIYVHYKWNMSDGYEKEYTQNPYFFGDPNVTTYVGEKNIPMPALTVLQMGDGSKVTTPNVTYSSSDESIVKIENGTISAVGVGSAVITAQVRFTVYTKLLPIPITFNSYASFIVDCRELDDLNVDAENIMMYTTDAEVKQPFVTVSYKQDGIITQLKEGDDYSLQYEVIDAGQSESLSQSKIKGGSSITLKGTAGNWEAFNAAIVRVTVTPTEEAMHTYHVRATTADFNYTVSAPNAKLDAVMDKPTDIYVGLNDEFDVSRLISMRYNGGTDVTDEFRFEYTFDNTYGADEAGVSVDANGILKTSGRSFNATLVIKAYGIKNPDENRIRFNNNEYSPINLHVGPYKKYSMSPALADISILKGDMESMPMINILKEDGTFESEEKFDLLIESSNESVVKLKDMGNMLPELQAVEKGKSTITLVVHAKTAGQYCDTQFSFIVNVVDGGGYRVQKDDIAEVGKDMEIKTLDGRVLCTAYLGGWTFKPGMQAGEMTFGDGTKNWSDAKKDLPLNSYYEYRFGGDDLNIPLNEDGTAAAPATVANSSMLHNAFNVPVEGSYIVFTPKTRGTVKAYVYQHYVRGSSVAVVSSLNAKATISGTLMNAYSGTLKKSSNTYSISKAPGAMVCYSFDVLPGETYYLYNKNSRLSFYGYEFVEKAGLTTSKKTYNDTKDNAVSATGVSAVSTATVSKTFKAGVWTSAMLPFSLNEKQLGEIFGPLYGRYNESSKNGECTQIVYFQRADINTGKLYFTRHAQNTISRGVPFLILPMHDATINTANIEDKNIYSAATYSSVKNNDGTTTKVPTQVRFGENEDFVWTASYVIQTINPGDYYFNTDGVVKRREVSPAKVRSLSGFLEAKTPEAQQAKLMSVVIGGFDDEDDDVTYIMEVGYDENGNFTMKPVQDGKVYDLNGQMVSESADNIDSLPTGIYIINGKKYTVK